MCGISGIAGQEWLGRSQIAAMMAAQHHRGPDDSGIYIDQSGRAGLGHNRLSIIDTSAAAHQPMRNADGTLCLIFNGEIYNYLELKAELAEYPFRSESDSEVILAAYERWGEQCLDHFNGMFAFAIWNCCTRRVFIARDRFGVKPLYYATTPDGTLFFASEIKALHAAGIQAAPDVTTWAAYLTYATYDHSEGTFWKDIRSLPAGHAMAWQNGALSTWRWYDLAERVGIEFDERPRRVVAEEYAALLKESVRLRFRSDVPVGINLSGGLDSSTLLGLVQAVQGPESSVKTFTFVTGDARYDELPWVQQMLARTRHPLVISTLRPERVPELAASVQLHEDEPFGGLPTLAYARLFEDARKDGAIVLLDGQGMDEQWAGYEYYQNCLSPEAGKVPVTGPVQGSSCAPARPECLTPEFRAHATALPEPRYFRDALRNRQYLDIGHLKIPRALRFNDRISMRSSTELREPFLDHRLVELAMRQPPERKIKEGHHKWLLREIVRKLVPSEIVAAPKRPLQTPQREWLRGELKDWVSDCINDALAAFGGCWLNSGAVRQAWQQYYEHKCDNSFYIWQWINLALWRNISFHPTTTRPQNPQTHVMAAAE